MIIGLHGYDGRHAVGAPPQVTDNQAILIGVIGLGLMAAGYLSLRQEEQRGWAAGRSKAASREREADLRRRGYDVRRVSVPGGTAVVKRGRGLWT